MTSSMMWSWSKRFFKSHSLCCATSALGLISSWENNLKMAFNWSKKRRRILFRDQKLRNSFGLTPSFKVLSTRTSLPTMATVSITQTVNKKRQICSRRSELTTLKSSVSASSTAKRVWKLMRSRCSLARSRSSSTKSD